MKSLKSNTIIFVVMKIIFEASVSRRACQCHSLIDGVSSHKLHIENK